MIISRSLWIVMIAAAISLNSCVEAIDQYPALAPGIWRAVLKLDDVSQIQNSDLENWNLSMETLSGELPFNFEVKYSSPDSFYIEIINDSERIVLHEIEYGKDYAMAKDTVIIHFPVYDTYIKGIFKENMMEGRWYVPNRGNYSIPFLAFHGQSHRFRTTNETPAMNLTGRWEAVFEIGEESEYPALAELVQNENKLTGTILTNTGDYRFLEGTVQGDKFFLSCFDGAHSFLFEGKIQEDSTLFGSFRNGRHHKAVWKATRNENFELPDPYDLTYLVDESKPFNFSFENLDGQMISLTDPAFEGKPKLVQILGTWCPNCRDETKYLVDYLKENDTKDLQVITIAFEKYKEKEKAIRVLKNYRDRMKIPYEIVYGGYYNKKEASQTMSMLNRISSYPTLLFVDRKNVVTRIHTGFNGPATSQYEEFKEQFHSNVSALIASDE